MRHKHLTILVFTLYLLLLSFTHTSGSEDVIKAIEVEGLTRMSQEELIDLICFRVGDRLDRSELSRGIRRAFRKGIFTDIKVVSEPYDGGIRLKYIVKEIPVVKGITIKGNRWVSPKKLKEIFIFKEGEDFREEFLSRAESELLDFYHKKGFPRASVKITVSKEAPGKVNIGVSIEEGEPLIIKEIEVPQEVRDYIDISPGDIYDTEVVEKEVERLKAYYKKRSYIKPIVGPYSFSDGVLKIPVEPGQRLEVYFKENFAISTKRLMKELTFMEDEEVTEESIKEAVERIRRLYLSKGYYYANVAAGMESLEDVIRVTLFIFEGKRVILKAIGFQGITFSPEVLKGIIPLEEEKPFNANLLSDSRESIIRFYNALGYLQADVTEIKKEFKEDGTELYVEFIVNEGPQTTIKEINITGNKAIETAEIRSVIHLRETDPYNVIDVGDARYAIQNLYRRYGYLEARVDVETIIDNGMAFINFYIEEDKPSIIGKVIIRGNRKTRDKIIRREVTLKEGDPFNYEELLRIKQRLYNLGLFDEVSIEILEPEPSAVKEDRIARDMLITLREGKAGAVEIGLGYGDYERFRGSFDISYSNLGGYNRRIGFRVNGSSVEQRYAFNFREPWLFNKPNLPFTFFLIKEKKRSINLDTKEVLYRIDKLSILGSIEKDLTRRLKAGISYEYSFVDTKDVKPGVILSREDTGTLGIGSISPSLFYDTRDDPFDPTSGSLNGVVLKFASKAFFSETEFIKATFQSSWFFELKRGLVFATSFRGGVAHASGGIDELPLVERFFLGGRTTVRGYSHDTLGPKSAEGDPTGGNVFALINGEFRISLGRGFGLVTFVDGGNVWKVIDDVEFPLKYTAGIGLRYRTPVGPVRIDYGHKLNREAGESTGEIHFSFGHAF